jgi:hypothetical protein
MESNRTISARSNAALREEAPRGSQTSYIPCDTLSIRIYLGNMTLKYTNSINKINLAHISTDLNLWQYNIT